MVTPCSDATFQPLPSARALAKLPLAIATAQIQGKSCLNQGRPGWYSVAPRQGILGLTLFRAESKMTKNRKTQMPHATTMICGFLLKSVWSSNISDAIPAGIATRTPSTTRRQPSEGFVSGSPIEAAHTSRITGRISGRLAVCLLRKRFRSARIFSLITLQSVFSSALD